MSTEITTAFVKQYGANVFHLSQQKGSRMRNLVRVESITGDSRFFDRIGKAAAYLRSGRHSDTVYADTPHSRRMVTMADYVYSDLVDDVDKLRTLNDPTNEYSQAAQWALGRSMDDVLIAAASGSAYGGVGGATAVVLPTTQKLMSCNAAGTAGAPLNVQALRRCQQFFDQADVDESEQRHFAFNALQKQFLLSATEVSSSDYNTIKALVMGQIDTYMGFKFVRVEGLVDQASSLKFDPATGLYDNTTTDSNGFDRCLAWAKSGLLLAVGKDISATIDRLPSKNNSTQVYASMSIGGTRMEEEKVVEIHCKES